MKTPFLLLFVFISLVYSCSKTNSSNNSGNKPNIYVGGLTGTLGYSTQGVVWKNDSAINYLNAAGITSLCLSGTDLYTVDGNVYWKNEVPTTLPDIRVSNQILVSGNDVYITGSSLTSNNTATAAAVYWKNGNLINLTQNIPNIVAAFTKGVAVSGSDVYVCGYLYSGYNDSLDAVYWKNGQVNYLPNGYMAKCIAVSGSDVYVGGTSLHNGDVYWKNGVMQSLGNNAWVNAITVSGADVYIGGFTVSGPDQGVYWKNGQVVAQLPGCNAATGIAVYGSDVYCSGNTNSNYAAFWKNGVPDTLGIGNASSIAVGP